MVVEERYGIGLKKIERVHFNVLHPGNFNYNMQHGGTHTHTHIHKKMEKQ